MPLHCDWSRMQTDKKNRESTNNAVEALRGVICNNLNRFVDEAGITRNELAKAVGVTHRSVSKWLSGETCIDVDHIKPVCDYLGVPMHALLGEKSSYTETTLESRELLGLFCRLDEIGRAKVVGYLEDLIASGKYAAS